MEPEQQRRIASKGGKAAHQSGHAHEWDSAEAAEAGRKGGLASHHDRASFHRESAAHHQTQASKYRSEGSHERADLHDESARSHAKQAEEQSAAQGQEEADPRSTRPAPREQYVEPPRGSDESWEAGEEEEQGASGEEERPEDEQSSESTQHRSGSPSGSMAEHRG